MDVPVCGIVLAAGLGTRMRSDKPKALHQVGGVPMVSLVCAALRQNGISPIIAVVSPDAPEVAAALGVGAIIVPQHERLGTGHAAAQTLEVMPAEGLALITFGDTPLLRAETLRALVAAHVDAHQREPRLEATIVSAVLQDPTGYGRVVRGDGGWVAGLVEQGDCTPEQAEIKEVFSGILIAPVAVLRRHLPRLQRDNAQREYLLTDVPRLIVSGGGLVAALGAAPEEVRGVNSRRQLAEANQLVWRRELERLMEHGVTVLDPASTFVSPGVAVGRDTIIWPGCYLLGRTIVGAGCHIGPQAYLEDAVLGNSVTVRFSSVEGSEIGDEVTIGPYSHIRPGTRLGSQVKVGNFAEIKNSRVGSGSKVSHHSYVGDAELGQGVNVGAGAVFVNYDGRDKHSTKVGDGAFIGCNANLVAPLELGHQAYIACGSTINRDVPDGALAIGRGRQRNVLGWVARRTGQGAARDHAKRVRGSVPRQSKRDTTQEPEAEPRK